jgi:hypothetical protein
VDVLHIYTIEYYAAIKRNEILSFGGKWMELESIMLSRISRTKDKYPVFLLICRKTLLQKGNSCGRPSEREKVKEEGDGDKYDQSVLYIFIYMKIAYM